jgi:hypothetical protein
MDAHWARVYAAPWLTRRIRGRSSGDGITPKRPRLLPLAEAAAHAGLEL